MVASQVLSVEMVAVRSRPIENIIALLALQTAILVPDNGHAWRRQQAHGVPLPVLEDQGERRFLGLTAELREVVPGQPAACVLGDVFVRGVRADCDVWLA
jgi:hypothetical protein